MTRKMNIITCPPPVKSADRKSFQDFYTDFRGEFFNKICLIKQKQLFFNESFFKQAFTLAEVLITLGVIGIVAAMTLPSLINKAQSMILKNQYKKAYSTFFNAIKLVQAKNEAPIECYYWANKPYPDAVCIGYNEYGSCNKWSFADGSPLPSDINGGMTECKIFRQQLFETLNVVTYCPQNALERGCITDKHKGIDKVKKEQNPSTTPDPNAAYSDINIKVNWPAWVLADGTIILGYSTTTPIFTIDINGHKSPNKWGYDMFSFQLIGDKVNGITGLKPLNYATEKGGKHGQHMYEEVFAGK